MPEGIPEGFRQLRLPMNPFLDVNGPLYGRIDEGRFTLGIRVGERHCNPGGTCHGGMLLTLADMTLIVGTNVQTRIQRYMTTVSLSTDFLRAAQRDAWIEGRTEVLRVARSMVFSQALLSVDGEPILRTSAILKPTGEPDSRFSEEHYFVG